jgi:hypothetical protein
MFENTRWSNPNYQPNFDYGQRVEAERQGMPWANFGVEAVNTIGKGIEAYAQRKRVDDILKQLYAGGGSSVTEAGNPVLAGGGGSVTEAGNPIVTGYIPPITEKELEELRKRYLQNRFADPYSIEYNFDYGVV